jgi:hypothetical protein
MVEKMQDAIGNIAKYSLLVSIRTSADVDLMTPTELIISNKVKTPISIDALQKRGLLSNLLFLNPRRFGQGQ